MTDAELIEAVATEVMGWDARAVLNVEVDMEGYPFNGKETMTVLDSWHPLDNWNHTMQVIRAMQAQSYQFYWDDDKDGQQDIGFYDHGSGGIYSPFSERGHEQWAILEAALMAARGEVLLTIPSERMERIAENHQPPQEWYDSKEDVPCE